MKPTPTLTTAFANATTSALVVVASLLLAPQATYAKGPNDPATECLITVSAGGSAANLQCKDGDACDTDGQTGNGSCAIDVTACVNTAATGCVAQELKSATVNPKKLGLVLTPNGTALVCESATAILPLRGPKKDKPSKKTTIVATARGTRKGVKDVDKLKVQCVPCGAASCVPPTTSTVAASTSTTSTAVGPASTSTSTIGPATTTSTSTVGSTTTTSTAASTSTSMIGATTTTISTTTSTSLSGFDFLSTAGAGDCGHTYRDLGETVPLKNLGCGKLSLGGGISQVPDNTTPSGATNRFSLSGCVGSVCDIGAIASGATPAGVDCTDVGCSFGVPLPISNAGLSVCVTNTFSAPPSGTLDLDSGDADWDFELNSATVLTGLPSQPCPICAVSVGGAACSGSPASPCTGVCDGSPNQGAACESKNPNGLSRDCPSPAATTGNQKCFRGTQNNNPCSTGTDCPGGQCAQFIGNIAISLKPLTTGTSSLTPYDVVGCTGVGTPFACCTGAGTGECTGVFCSTQTKSQHGAFNTAICLSGPNSGKPCTNNTTVPAADDAHCGSGNLCRPGTGFNYCSGGANDGLGCSSAATCPAPGTCSKAGTLAQVIRNEGVAAGALTPGVAKPITLGSAFCVGATSNAIVNSNANLPGPGATSIVGTVTLLP
jgi:hypothetical protein